MYLYALSNYNGTILFTSHDRTFVSLLSDTIIEVKQGNINTYPSNYDNYVYHIKEQMLREIEEEEKYLSKNSTSSNSNGSSNNTNKQPSDYHARKMLKSNITKMTSILAKSEKNIAEYEKEKQEINSMSYSNIAAKSAKAAINNLGPVSTNFDTPFPPKLTSLPRFFKHGSTC